MRRLLQHRPPVGLARVAVADRLADAGIDFFVFVALARSGHFRCDPIERRFEVPLDVVRERLQRETYRQ